MSGLPLLFPDAVQADYVPWFVFRGGRTDNAGQYQTDRGPFTNENITHDVIANLTKVWGSHASKAGFYYQNSFKPQSIFASFNSQIDFTDNTNNPFDTGFSYANAATGVFNFYQQANKFAMPEWRYKNFEWYAQDNWKPSQRLTLDYGVRFYYLTPQWDTTPAGLQLPARPVQPERRREAVLPGLHRRASVLGRCPARHGSDAHRPGRHADGGEHGRGALHRPADARLEPVQRRLPGRPGHQRSAAGRQRLPGLPACRRGLRPDAARARPSFAAAGGSSTTGRRATWCST